MQNQVVESVKRQDSQYLSNDSSFLIDILRVIACEMVVICHVAYIYDQYFSLTKNNTNPLYELDIFLGDLGVIIFFIVSGIVISNSLFRKLDLNKSYGFMNYFIDRFSRIYTGLIPCLIFIFICDLAMLAINSGYFYQFNTGGISITAFVGNLFMLQNLKLTGINVPAFGGQLWTLNIEWWLYLLFGWIVVNLKKGAKWGLFFLIPLLLFAYYPLTLFITDASENLVLVWFMGVTATLVYLFSDIISWNKRLNYAIIALGVLIIGRIGSIYYFNGQFFDLTLEVLLVLVLILLMAKYKNSDRFGTSKFKKAVKFMGKYAFTLYLTHFVIENLIFSIYLTLGMKYSLIAVFGFAIILSNIIAILVAYYTEMRYRAVAKFFNRVYSNLSNKNE